MKTISPPLYENDSSPDRIFRVIQLSDSHLLTDADDRLKGVATWRTFESVMERIARENPQPDLLIATGDLVHDGPLAVYARFRECIGSIGIPVRVLPGNHDDPALLAGIFGVDPEQSAANATDTINFGHAILGNWLMVFLNTIVPDMQYGMLDARELARLDALLGDHPGYHALLCLHHHPIPRKDEVAHFPGLRNAESFFSVVDRHPQVRGVIWGHIHSAFEAGRGDIRLFGTPSTCFQFNTVLEQIPPAEGPPAYRRLMLKPDGVIESEVAPVLSGVDVA